MGSADKVVFPVPDNPKKIDVSPSIPTFELQCIGKTFLYIGNIKFNIEKIAFLISPVYPVPPIIITLVLKLIIEKFSLLVLSTLGLAKKFGALIKSQSSLKDEI